MLQHDACHLRHSFPSFPLPAPPRFSLHPVALQLLFPSFPRPIFLPNSPACPYTPPLPPFPPHRIQFVFTPALQSLECRMCAICTSFHLAAQLGGTHLTRLRIVLPTLRTPLDSLVHLSSLSAMEVSAWVGECMEG